MSIVVTSNEPQKDATAAQQSGLASNAEETVDETKEESAPADEQGEKVDESETSDEPTEGEENETKEGDEDSEEKEDQEGEAGQDKKPKKLNGYQRRIKKLNAKVSKAEQEKEYWREMALKSQTKPAAENDPKPEIAESTGKPKADDFETHEEYLEALTDWKADQKFASYEAKQKEAQLRKEQQTLEGSYAKKEAEFKAKHDDYDEVMDDVADIQVSLAVKELVLRSGPELAYQLAKNRDELERICTLPPLDAAEAIGEFKAKLKNTSESPKQTKVTKAPKPPTPVKPMGASTKKSIFDAETQQEYEAIRREQMKQRASAWG